MRQRQRRGLLKKEGMTTPGWLVGALLLAAAALPGDVEPRRPAAARPPPTPTHPRVSEGDLPTGVDSDWLARIQRGLARREYRASLGRKGLQAPNRANDLRTYFEPTGIRVHDRTAAGSPELLTLRWTGVGRGSSLAPVAPGEVSHEDARVEIRREGLVEWYENSSAGLEQGFTLDAPPPGDGQLVLEVALDGARASASGDSLRLTSTAGRRLAYGKLSVVDADGRTASARLVAATPERIRIEVDDAGARYPLVVDPLLSEISDAQLEANQAGADLGSSVASAGDVNGDGHADVIVGADGYDAGESDEGAAFVFLGGPGGIASADPSTADAQLESDQPSAAFGWSVAGAGDVNGDGYDDVIVGADLYDAPDADEGAAFVFLGSAAGIASGSPATAAAQLESDQAGARFGHQVAAAGDVNGDGYADVIVGAHLYDAGQSGEGAAFVFLGSASGVASANPSTADAQIESDQADAQLGTSVARAGDVNGDGYADVIVGAPGYDAPSPGEGAAFVFLGGAGGIASGGPAAADSQLESNQAGAALGTSVAGAGDVNGDGYADVVVGADAYHAGQNGEGAAFVFHGSAAGITGTAPASSDAQLEANQSGAGLGGSVASAGDVNGDGYADVIVGAPSYTNGESGEGAAFVFLGTGQGVVDVDPTTAYARLEANQAGALFGSAVAGAGDVNGDGYSDVIVGARNHDSGSGPGEGAAFVYLGGAPGVVDGDPATAGAQITPGPGIISGASGNLAEIVASAGDVNGDGYDDVIVGVSAFSNGEGSEGAAFVFHGSASGIASGDTSTADAQLEGNQVGAAFGLLVAGAGDVNGDGYSDVIVGTNYYDVSPSDEGAVFVFHGSASGITGTSPADADAVISSVGHQLSQLGTAADGAGDVNGDGYADVIVGASNFDTAGGAAFVYLGSAAGITGTSLDDADARIESDTTNAKLGDAVAGAGDVNGDGYADVIVGARNFPFPYDGGAFVFHGSAAGITATSNAEADAQLFSNGNGANFGYSVDAADVNGDGYADVVIGTAGYDITGGAVSVFHGSASGITGTSPADADATLHGDLAQQYFGGGVGAGDVNGDGYADILAVASDYTGGETDEGVVFVFLGSAVGITASSPADADALLESNQVGSAFGAGLAGAGDLNGDGYPDVIVGAPNYDSGQGAQGAAFVFYGGGHTGRPVRAQQLRGGGSATPVQPWGASLQADDFQVRGNATDPSGRSRAKLEVEACPPGVPFGDASCSHATSSTWTDVTASATGVAITQSLPLDRGTLYRWRERVLHAPFGVTQPGITAPPNPAHGPWRRLGGQAVEADIRIRSAADSDGDGLLDFAETGTGIYVSPTDTGTDPLDADTDGDGYCDGSGTGGGTCSADDNCLLVANPSQANGDSLPPGNACQCGDVSGDDGINTSDLQVLREHVVGRTPSVPFDPDRCDVNGDTSCGVEDAFVLARFLDGGGSPVQDTCPAYTGP